MRAPRVCSKVVPIFVTNPIATAIEWPLGLPTLRTVPRVIPVFVVYAIYRESMVSNSCVMSGGVCAAYLEYHRRVERRSVGKN